MNKQFELFECIFDSVYVDLVVCHVVVFGRSVDCRDNLCGCGSCCESDAYTAVCVSCVYAEIV